MDDVRKIAMPLPFNPPSQVLFSLLGFLVDAGKGVVRTTLDEMSDTNQNVPVGTTLAKIEQGLATVAATGVILSAAYMLWMFQRVNYGPVSEKNATLRDLTPREWVLLVPIIVMALLMGIFPGVFLKPMAPSIERTLDTMRRGTSVQARIVGDVPLKTLALRAPSAVDGGVR